ncbi:hypothetical protein PG984_014618 [Apiospora sp. TS-2023a]
MCLFANGDPYFWQEYQIFGSHYHDDLVGKWGEHLRNQLKGCGATSNWHFEYKQSDGKKEWEWKSWFSLPINTVGCVESKINIIGGNGVRCIELVH